MKLWKRWTAAALAAAMALLLLAACGPSGPSAPDAPDKPGSSETGKDPTDKKTEAQKVAAVVEALNAVRCSKDYDQTSLTMDAEACAMAEKMAKLQLDGKIGKYGTDPMKSEQYAEDWNAISKLTIKDKKLVGVGGYVGYPTKSVISGWAKNGSTQKKALAMDSATLVGVGVVHNTDEKTKDQYPIMVVVMTY